MKTAYIGAEALAYQDAMRLVPAAAAARLRGAPADAFMLYQGYIDDQGKIGVAAEQAWSILAAAGVIWATSLLERQAQLEGVCSHDVVVRAVAHAQDWVINGGS